MRARVITLAALLYPLSPALAVIETVSTSISSQSVSGNLDPGNLQGATQTSRISQSVKMKIEDIKNYFTVNAGLTHATPDYSNYLIETNTGQDVPLSSLPQGQLGDEYSANANLTFSSAQHLATLGWDGSLNPSPFSSQAVSASYIEGFFNKTTLLGVRTRYYEAHQPDSYYIAIDYTTQERPQLLHGNDTALTLSQVLNETWKVGIEASTGQRLEDRPRNVGLTLKQAYALSDRVFTRLELNRINELHSYTLKDERGYFTLSAAELTLSYEPWVDFLASITYGYVVENESDPRTSREVQVGSDQYGIGLKYRKRDWTFELQSGYRLTNTGLNELNGQGSLSLRI